MLKLELQYFGHLMHRTDSGKAVMLGDRGQEDKGMREDKMVG